MPQKLNITVLENGPLKISNAQTLHYLGQRVDGGDGDVFICRCGESRNAPFCDGSHGSAGFDGFSEPKTEKEVKVWEGKSIRTYFNPNACMHVFYCKPLKELREQELMGDDTAAAEIAKVVQSCPSGALSFEMKGDVPLTLPIVSERPDVDIVDGGEVRIQCDFDINQDLQERQEKNRATLCRCGKSKNKPWCDGRHKGRKDFI